MAYSDNEAMGQMMTMMNGGNLSARTLRCLGVSERINYELTYVMFYFVNINRLVIFILLYTCMLDYFYIGIIVLVFLSL